MTIASLRAAFGQAAARRTITPADVESFARAVEDHGAASPDERAALKAFAEQHRDLFEPDARQRLFALYAKLDAPRAPPRSAAVVSWSDFDVAADRAGLGGAQAAQGQATFDALGPAVASGTLTEPDRLLLASAVTQVGVLGEAQALRAVDRLAALTPLERARFAEAAAAARPLARAFLFEALAAGHGVEAVAAFAQTIAGWSDPTLVRMLNLSDVTDDGLDEGLKQQFQTSCVPTSGQVLRADVDPIYALEVRRRSPNLHAADDRDGLLINPAVAAEQKAELEAFGGEARGRTMGGAGVPWEKMADLYNARAPQTGVTYQLVDLEERQDLDDGAMLDAIVTQLEQGIPTPLLVGIDGAAKLHAMIALEVTGSGDAQQLLVHDPWEGKTTWVTRDQVLAHDLPLGPFKTLGGFHAASPAPLRPA